MSESWQKLGTALLEVATSLGRVAVDLHQAMPFWPLLVVWVAVWLGAVNWRRAGPVLAQGGWAPALLLGVAAALVWSRLAPSPGQWLGVPLANFWWQLIDVGLLAASALFCGWLQARLHWAPAEVDLSPPPPAEVTHGHEHPVGTLHGHEEAHADEHTH